MSKVITGEMSCSRNNHNKINIRVQCSESGANFLSIELTAEEFGKLITGLHMPDLTMEVNHLSRVGKRHVREDRSVEYPYVHRTRNEMEVWLMLNCRESGWTLNSTLNSQSSVEYVDGKTILNYSVFKFVDI